jgi:hypothetical protein
LRLKSDTENNNNISNDGKNNNYVSSHLKQIKRITRKGPSSASTGPSNKKHQQRSKQPL